MNTNYTNYTNNTNNTNNTNYTNNTKDDVTQEKEEKTLEPQGVIEDVVKKETKDLYLAAAFHAEGIKFIKIDKTDRTRMVFIFEGGENADRVEREWYQQSLLGCFPIYASSLRLCKSLIHQ